MREQLDTDLAAPILEVGSTTAIKAAVMGGIGPAVLSVRAGVTLCRELSAGATISYGKTYTVTITNKSNGAYTVT